MSLSRNLSRIALTAGFAAWMTAPTMAADATTTVDESQVQTSQAEENATMADATEALTIPPAEREAMAVEIEAILENARLDVASLLSQGASGEAADLLQEEASQIKTQAWADVYLTQARYARAAGLTEQADELDRLAGNTLNPTVPQIDPSQLRSTRRNAE